MRSMTVCLCLVGVAIFILAGSALAAAPAAGQEQGKTQDQWRYAFHNGEWWYWMPEGRWVYWRDNRWNDYDPRTFTASVSAGAMQDRSVGSRAGGQAAVSDNRPFYGHAISDWDVRPSSEASEIGPFYGRVLPGEVFGPWRSRIGSNRPYYGHATSSGD
jgi:hypothetical protein